MRAPINKIIDSSVVDGPGNRTAIFFQGCNFKCQYCHNPETMQLCRHCGACVAGCPAGALQMAGGKVVWEESICTDCGACYKNCPHSASPRVEDMTVEQVLQRVQKNMPFIRGITVSGGECSLYRDFIVELFTGAKALGLGTLMDSNGGRPLAGDEELMRVCDGVMLDVKGTDPDFHLELTGVSNRNVLDNVLALAKLGKLCEVRTVVLAGNAYSRQTVLDVVEMLRPYQKQNDITYRLIRFRPLGVRGPAEGWKMPGNAQMQELNALAEGQGFARVLVV